MTKLDIVTIVFCMVTSMGYAQTQRVDTIVLSVYNTSQRFLLHPMPFGKGLPEKGLSAELIASLDTANVWRERRDSAGIKVPVLEVERVCGKVSTTLKGKVALLHLNPACDVSTQVWNAQNAGASAVVMIHTTDNRDSVSLPAKGVYVDKQRITIPCYTVRQGMGETIGMLLPSLVGIKILTPDESRDNIQNRVTTPSSLGETPAEKTAVSLEEAGAILTNDWQLAPNPATDAIQIRYEFAEKAATQLQFFDEIGQLLQASELPPAQTGTFSVNVQSWRSGTYNLRLQHGTVIEVKRLTVIH